MKIACVDKEIKKILSEGFYKIPRFQRPYSWDKINIEEFWSDTVETYGGDYFIGSMVVYKKGDYYFVIDGQQRLTTITILLAVIRDKFKDLNNENLANGLQRMLERPDISNDEQYVVQPETSYPFLQEFIQKNSPPEIKIPDIGEEEKAIKEAHNQLTIKVRELVESEKNEKYAIKKLEKIRDQILSLKVIFVEVDNEDDAYIIFETMNTRGKDLESADLIKNQLSRLIRSKNKSVDAISTNWAAIRDNVEGRQADIGLDSFLYHHWLSRYGYVTQKEIFKSAKKIITKENATEFLKDLVSDSEVYSWIIDPSSKKWSNEEMSLKRSLEALLQFRVRQPLPMILSVLREYKGKNIDLKTAKSALTAIEHFHFIFTAVTSQRSSGGISFMYAHHARKLLASKDKPERIKEIRELKEKLTEKLPLQSEFDDAFMKISYSEANSKQKKLVQYILAKIQQYATKGVSIDWSGMSIEHIAPQSGDLDGPTIASIGNLISVESKFNSIDLANKSFEQKKKIMIDAKLTLDKIITDAEKWGPNEINSRANYLSNISYGEIFEF